MKDASKSIQAAMDSPNLTPRQRAQRKYNLTHKEERKRRRKTMAVNLLTDEYNEIRDFCRAHHITYVTLARTGYQTLKERYK